MENRKYVDVVMNRKSDKTTFFVIFSLILSALPFVASAYQIDTHALLTDETISFYNAHSDNDLPSDARAFLIDGTRREDDAPRWMNHFYDPIHERGLSYDPKINPEIPTGDWQKSKEWAEDGDNQNKLTYKVPATIASILTAVERWKISEITSKTDFTWREAIRHYVNGDTEQAFFTLGHILHLIQDTSVPDHTRNDPHPGDSPYENFAGKYNLSNVDKNLTDKLKTKSLIELKKLDEYFNGLAKYSSNNFYSKDTIGIQTGFSIPEQEYVSESNNYFYGIKRDENGVEYKLLAYKISPSSILLSNNTDIGLAFTGEDGEVLQDYWSLLSVKSVEYGAGVIDLFFREAEKAKNDPNFDRSESKSFLSKVGDMIRFGVQETGSVLRNLFGNGAGDYTGVGGEQTNGTYDEYESGEDDEGSGDIEVAVNTPKPKSVFETLIEPTDNATVAVLENATNGSGGVVDEELIFDEDDSESENDESELTPEHQNENEDFEEGSEAASNNASNNESADICEFNASKIVSDKKVILNEIAWMGTPESFSKEWFELKNTSTSKVDMSGWQVTDLEKDIKISLPSGVVLEPAAFLLFERTSDESVKNIKADFIYTGNLSNDGTNKTEGLRLFNSECALADEALASPWWPAGDNKDKRTMERDSNSAAWHTSSAIGGTPKAENSASYVPPSSSGSSSGSSGTTDNDSNQTDEPQPQFFSVKINEIFYDAPGADDGKEWLELLNEDQTAVDLSDWKIYESDVNHSLSLIRGSSTTLSGGYTIVAENADEFMLQYPNFTGNLFQSSFALSNGGETITLNNQELEIGVVSYSTSTGANGDGDSLQKIEGVWRAAPPTPGSVNIIPNQPPQTSFSFTPSEPLAGQFVNFEASSTDPDGVITDYYWTFGDGMNQSGASTTASHMYSSEGNFEVTLVAFDNDGATASSSQVIYISSSSTQVEAASHIVISEVFFNAEETDKGKEFVELYNPTANDENFDGWSLSYSRENSTSSGPLTSFNASSGDKTIIPAKGFLLVGLNSYNSSINGVAADVTRSASLPNGSERISVELSNAQGDVIDVADYTESSAAEGQSIERKTIFQNACTSAAGEGEYEGHLCDRNSIGDFEARGVPRPQNSANLPEPRERPAAPANATLTISENDKLALKLAWEANESASQSITGTITYFISDTSAAENKFANTETNSTSTSFSIMEIGREYKFEMYAADKDGYQSEKIERSLNVPSFLKTLNLYRDPRETNENYYVADLEWSEFPFIPKKFGGYGYQAVIFDTNRLPNIENPELSCNENFLPRVGSGIAWVKYPTCVADNINTATNNNFLIIPLSSDRCRTDVGYLNSSYSFPRFEDSRASVRISLSGAPSSSDFITVAYYDMNGWGHFELVALDQTKTFFAEPPSSAAPIISGEPAVSFDEIASKIRIAAPRVSDTDTFDNDLAVEMNFTSSSADGYAPFDESLWVSASSLSSGKTVAPGDDLLIGVRAKDDFGNISEIATTTWAYPPVRFFISQTVSNDWSDLLGEVKHSRFEPDTASFQSIVPQEDFSFDVVSVRVRQEMVNDYVWLRLSVLADSGGAPDFANEIAHANSSSIFRPPPDMDLTFTFNSPVALEKDRVYWLALDAGNGHDRNSWRAATASGGEVYPYGIGGTGRFRGENASCAVTSEPCDFRAGNIGDAAFDWYMRIGERAE